MASSRLGSITNCLKRLRQFAPVHKSETSVNNIDVQIVNLLTNSMPSLTSTEQKVKRKTTSLIVVFQYRQKDKRTNVTADNKPPQNIDCQRGETWLLSSNCDIIKRINTKVNGYNKKECDNK